MRFYKAVNLNLYFRQNL